MKKRLLALVSSLALTFTAIAPVSASALIQPEIANGGLSDYLSTYDDDTIVVQTDGKTAIIITGDYEIKYFKEWSYGTSIKVKKGADIPLEEVSELIEGDKNRISKLDVDSKSYDEYTLYVSDNEKKTAAYELLKQCPDVISIDEKSSIRQQISPWAVTNITLNGDIDIDALMAEYSELNLTYDSVLSIPESNVYDFQLSEPLGSGACSKKYYDFFKTLIEKEVDYSLTTMLTTTINGEADSSQVSKNIYTNLEAFDYGDANCDGNVDISDVVLIKGYTINPEKYLLAAPFLADITGNGNGVNAQDAVALQQYLLGTVKSLPIAE
ncbi:MAG: dockerin type I repeat-containing protein [Ruminococcus sp.]|nr:dockerin type I repeat-containing protein [Ruminococcus sp.]MDY3214028.1 dockerin type I repeat-containing protein [Ruminococcus sp.]